MYGWHNATGIAWYHAAAGAHRVAALFCLQAAFNVFDVGGRGRIDILEVFAAISLASDVRVAVWLCGCWFRAPPQPYSRPPDMQASPNERKKFTFQFYDFDGEPPVVS